MKTLIIAFLTLLSTFAIAQNTVTWIGGTPGKETSWDEPRNWDNYQTPDEDSHVVIKLIHTGHYSQPVITESVEVASIEIQTGATLTIEENGEVLIDGIDTYTQGIVNTGGNLVNEGQISLVNIEDFPTENLQITLIGKGLVTVDGKSFNESLLVNN